MKSGSKPKHSEACRKAHFLIKNLCEDYETRDLFLDAKEASEGCPVCKTAKQAHTSEPWTTGIDWVDDDVIVFGGPYGKTAVADLLGANMPTDNEVIEANARRIVQCINACAGIENPGESIKELVEAANKAYTELSQIAWLNPGRVNEAKFLTDLRAALAKMGVK